MEFCHPITLTIARGLKYGMTIHSALWKNSDGTPQRYRVNGQVKLWKTRPTEFRIPLKRGMYEYGYLTHANADSFALGSGLICEGNHPATDAIPTTEW